MANFKEVTGTFLVPYESKETGADNDSSDDDDVDDNDAFLLEINAAENVVRSRVPKSTKVEIKDNMGKKHVCLGKFSLTQPYWKVTVQIDRESQELKTRPVYALRMDEDVKIKNMPMMFLSDCLEAARDPDVVNGTKGCFDYFCRSNGLNNNLMFADLKDVFVRYQAQERRDGCCLSKSPNGARFGLVGEDHYIHVKEYVLKSELGATVLVAADLPQLVRIVSQLFPYSFSQILHKLSQLPNYLSNKSKNETQNNIIEESDQRDEGESDAGSCKPQQWLQAKKEKNPFLSRADEMAKNSPWEFCFKEIIRKKLNLYGFEAALKVYKESGLLNITPEREKDAIHIYEVLKTDARNDGHMYVPFKALRQHQYYRKLEYAISGLKRWKSALDYMEESNVIKREEFGGDTQIFLRENWKAEVDTAEAVETIMKKHVENPLLWDIDLHCPEFSNIRSDEDQLHASHLICSAPIAVMSGRGGCGKTTVVTKLLKHLCDREERIIKMRQKIAEEQEAEASTSISPGKELTAHIKSESEDVDKDLAEEFLEKLPCSVEKPTTSGDLRQTLVYDLLKILSQIKEEDDPELTRYKERMLLTAPTGKAARLLGCKARLPSATLHSIIASWQAFNKSLMKMSPPSDKKLEWKYAKVEILVVDECSLLSVRLFANVVKILMRHAHLRKLILLGDIRQLPSIEPGEFLKDMFKTLNLTGTHHAETSHERFRLAVELTNNHRAESELIVGNAERISAMRMPTFDPNRNFHFVPISREGGDNERDEAIRELLEKAPELRSHYTSQFVAFRNADCTAVNELCCYFYNKHSLKRLSSSGKKERFDFKTGDKICLAKNNLVPNKHKVYLDKYRADFPELHQALRLEGNKLREKRKENMQVNSSGVEEGSSSKDRLDDTRLNSAEVTSLLDQDDATFDTSLLELRTKEERAKEVREARKQRAKQKQEQWKAQSEEKSVEKSLMAFLGKDQEKLCNGEVFFIMDEIDHFEERGDKNGSKAPVRYLVLSDRDPDLPRVVCVSFKELRKLCRMKHSWVRTIHTYQGSESETVVYVLGCVGYQTWQHVYTAVTRGRRTVYILCSQEELQKAVNRRDMPRRTRLRHRLEEVLAGQSKCLEICQSDFTERLRVDAKMSSFNCAATELNPAGDTSDLFDLEDSDNWLVLADAEQSPQNGREPSPTNILDASKSSVDLIFERTPTKPDGPSSPDIAVEHSPTNFLDVSKSSPVLSELRTPTKRLSDGTPAHATESSPCKVQTVRDEMNSPFFKTFSQSLTFDSEPERDTVATFSEESPLPAKRKL